MTEVDRKHSMVPAFPDKQVGNRLAKFRGSEAFCDEGKYLMARESQVSPSVPALVGC